MRLHSRSCSSKPMFPIRSWASTRRGASGHGSREKTHNQQCLLPFGGGRTISGDNFFAVALGTESGSSRAAAHRLAGGFAGRRQKGIGSRLLDFIEQDIARDQLKCPAVTLGTAIEHPWLPQLYENRGYEKIAETDLGLGHITAYFKKIIIKSFR